MKTTVGDLRRIVREVAKDCFGGSQPAEMYEQELESDPDLKKKSVLVPNDIKKSVKTWTQDMGLSGTKKKR